MTTPKPNIYHANPCPPCPATATAFEKAVYWLGIGLGSGLPKKAPGTWGSIGGVLPMLLMMALGTAAYIAITALGLVMGSFICGKTSDLMGGHDNPHIVFDEWVGLWLAYLPYVWLFGFDVGDIWAFLPFVFGSGVGAFLAIVPLVLFRLFDILKPPPIGLIDKKVGGGFGILIDDVVAGIMAAMVSLVVLFVTYWVMYFIYGP